MSTYPLLLYDGECMLCSRAVQYVLKHEAEHILHFAHLDSQVGQKWMSKVNSQRGPVDTLVLIEDGKVFLYSEAALRLSRYLIRPYSFLALGRIVPRLIRDAVYRFIARNRYTWFGKLDTECHVLNPSDLHRFHNSK